MEQNNKHDIYYKELLHLISGKMDIATQYVIFQTSQNQYFGLNVAKVEELIRNKNIDIVKSTNSDNLTIGVANIRDNITILLNFDDWIGEDIENKDELKLIILSKYSSFKMGLVVRNVIGIQSIDYDSLFDITQRDDKVSYVVEVMIKGEKKMCNIFDFDQLVADIYPNIKTINESLIDDMKIPIDKFSNKMVLVAEDSKLINEQLKILLDKINIPYHIFTNGKLLLEYLKKIDTDHIALILTDLEMPVMGGLNLIKNLKNDPKYSTIPIIVHTNITNNTIDEELDKLGVKNIVAKLNLIKLKESIMENIVC